MSENKAISVPRTLSVVAFAQGCTRQNCVILTLARHFPTKRVQFAPMSSRRGNQHCYVAARGPWAFQMQKEATPLWVWLSVALLAIGTVAYVTTVYFVEFIMTLF